MYLKRISYLSDSNIKNYKIRVMLTRSEVHVIQQITKIR